MSNTDKNLIVNLTRGNSCELKKKLHLNGDFKRHYDGWETSVDSTTGKFISTRLFYYGIDHDKMLGLLRHLRQVATDCDYNIKIQPAPIGNYHFDG